MFVARTTLRRPARAGSSAASCSRCRQLAVERQHVDVRAKVRFAEPRLRAPDLARARQEHEQVAGGFRERPAHDARDDRVRRLVAVPAWPGNAGKPLPT